MKKTFYHFLMKYRNIEGNTELENFANEAYHDHSFPKLSQDYHEISSYLEMNGHYLPSMRVFDDAWTIYGVEEK